jgi:hypothetical protein
VPEISVLIPLADARGDATEHLRTWTHDQTLARDRYQVVLTSDGEEPEVERAVARLLEPHDVLHVAPGAELMELYDTAARLAGSRWLLFTENHCTAAPDCLEAAARGVGEPGLEAATLQQGHLSTTAVGKLGERWFKGIQEQRSLPGQWRRLPFAGFLIRRDTYESEGGLDPRHARFASAPLAARLAQRGAHVGHLSKARFVHIHLDGVREHHSHSADYARGECEARTSLDPEFAERYFGHQHLVWNRSRLRPATARRAASLLARETGRAALRSRGDLSWLLEELRSGLPAAIGGARARRLLARLAFAWSELAAILGRGTGERRFRHYLRAQDRVVTLTQLRWIEGHPDGDAAAVSVGSRGIERLGPGSVVGVHGLERHDGRLFRWSEPVVTFRIDSLSRPGELRIDTGGLRGSPLASVVGAYLGTQRLPDADLSEQGDALVVRLPEGQANELTLVCRPLKPDPGGAPDRRRLGLPVFSVELSGP